MIGQTRGANYLHTRKNDQQINKLADSYKKYIKGHRRCCFLYVIQTNMNIKLKTKFAGQ